MYLINLLIILEINHLTIPSNKGFAIFASNFSYSRNSTVLCLTSFYTWGESKLILGAGNYGKIRLLTIL